MDAIIYHDGCPDGWCAAYIALLRYPNAELIPWTYSRPIPYDRIAGRDVIMVDISFENREENEKAAKIAKSFHIYEHHKSAITRMKDAPFATFDMNRSGAGLVWDYLFGEDSKLTITLSRPWWVNYVEDNDLWRFKFPNSKIVGSFLRSHPRTIESWDELRHGAITLLEATENGRGIERQVEYYVRAASACASPGRMFGYPALVVNSTYCMTSELGHELAVKSGGVGIVWFERNDGLIQFGLRSNGDIDVCAMAMVYGGGGHKNAAGFELPISRGRRVLDGILLRNPANLSETCYGRVGNTTN